MDQTEKFNKLAARLTDHADSITNAAAHQMEKDIRTASLVIESVGAIALQLNNLIV